MAAELIFVPILVHFFLVIGVYILLLLRKLAVKKKRDSFNYKATALNNKAWPDEVVVVSNNLDNQFEAPVLFYTLCVVIYLLKAVDSVTLLLAWFFVASRILHAFVHIGSNYVPVRMRVFAAGIFALVGMAGVAAHRLWAFL